MYATPLAIYMLVFCNDLYSTKTTTNWDFEEEHTHTFKKNKVKILFLEQGEIGSSVI